MLIEFPVMTANLPALLPTAAASPCACQQHQQGMGAIFDDMSPWLKYGLIGGGLLLMTGMFIRPEKAKYKRELSDARDEYESRIRTIRRKYPRMGSRLPF